MNFVNTVVNNNSANCSTGTCSGGGLAMTQSTCNAGVVHIDRSVFERNFASTFGGGLYLGGPSPGLSSCSVGLSNTVVAGNSALQAGNQIYNNCGGNLSVSSTNITMVNSATEVRKTMRPLAISIQSPCDVCRSWFL